MPNLLDLYVTLGVKDNASKQIDSFSTKMSKGLATAAKIGTTAVIAGMVKVSREAVYAYAEYEQLAGGVETLFGSSADKLMAYADEAYKTANMSANKYMETATGFAASLIQGLEGDTEKAAELANMAITDMADNVNKFGASQEAVQNAYAGFAKQNYTMLDNLKLGYGGTKEEMERLIDTANAAKERVGEVGDLDINNFANIIEAIHIIQDEMGITGATAAEAAETVEGSINTMQAAYENWVAAIGSGDELEEKTQALIDSTLVAAENAAPLLGRIVESFSILLQEGFGAVADWLFGWFTEDLFALSAESARVGTEIAQTFTDGVSKAGDWLDEKLVNPAEEKFERLNTIATEKMENAKQAVHAAIDNMKAALDFEWSLPHLKLPRVTISGSFSLNPPSVPHFGLEWYAAGGILTQPTMFGFNPFTGNAMIGGEAGAEAIAPISTLQDYIAEAVDGGSAGILRQILEALITLINDGPVWEININNETNIDGATVARKMYSHIVDEANRRGPKLIT